MFESINIPLELKRISHRRSKTNYVLNQVDKNLQTSKRSLSLESQPYDSKSSTHGFKPVFPQKHIDKKNEAFKTIKKMKYKIENLIQKELQFPEFVSSINQNLSRRYTNLSPEINSAKKSKFIDSENFNQRADDQFLSQSQQSQLQALIKQSSKINSKSFVPHYNWRQKLTKLKNLGNYGQIYKKKSQKLVQNRILYIKPPNKNETINSTKTMLASNEDFFPERKMMKNLRFHQINDQDLQEKLISLKRKNKTCTIGNRLYEESIKKNPNPEKANFIVKKGRLGEKEWKFEPWEDLE